MFPFGFASTFFTGYSITTNPVVIDPMHQPFTDIDETVIRALVRDETQSASMFKIRSPPGKKLATRDIHTTYFDRTSTLLDALLLHKLTEMQHDSVMKEDGFVVCGFDTETGKKGDVELIQLCMKNCVILIHKHSGLFSSEHLKRFFLNELFPDKRIVFAGAELATADALDLLQIGLPVIGLLDLSPVYSQPDDRHLSFFSIDIKKFVSLKGMFNATFGTTWHKDKKITCSDWGVKELTMPQIKYAALDAWTSSELGIHALQTYQTHGIYKMIFATIDINLALCVNDELLVKQMIRQARELEEMNVKEPKIAVVDNLRVVYFRANSLELSCFDYGNRVHKNIKRVEIRLISPGGSDRGVSLFAELVPEKTKGKVSMITIDLASINEIEAKTEVDRNRLRELQRDPLRTILKYWSYEDEQSGRYAQRTMNRRDQIQKSERYVRVRFYCHEQPDSLLQQVRLTVSDFVRSHFAPLDFVSPPLVDIVVAERDAIKGLKVGTSTTIYSLGIDLLSQRVFNNTAMHLLTEAQEDAIETHIETLNFAQGVALQNAFSHRISVIKGPPGTGKTRTIAAIADVAQTGNRRVLIIAPGNSASRRILESLVKTGFQEACLVVSEGYFFEWHEEAYAGDKLSNYVHTKCVFEDESKRSAGGGQKHRRAADREHVDFRPRTEREHVNKWLKVAKGEDKEAKSKPVVVIGTYGTIANNGGICKGTSRGWAEHVQNLLAIHSIDMLIIDETSQLWSGYGMSLLANLSALKNIVLVGDEDQLAPYGATEVRSLKSLFDSAITHPSVPHSVLNTTYRLTPPVAQLLSREIYKNMLVSARYEPADVMFRRHISHDVLTLAPKAAHTTHSFDFCVLLHRLCNTTDLRPNSGTFPSLAWVHVQGQAHANPESKSQGNERESEIVASCAAQLLMELDSIRHRYPDNDSNPASMKVVIITGYREQKDVIEKDLGHRLQELNYRGWGGVETMEWVQSSMIVNTVDSFQGQEADIVFISTVRSLVSGHQLQGLGFAKDQRRANVMLSRASQLMVVVGDALNMASQSQSLLIPSLAYSCSDHNSMFEIDRGGELQAFKLPTDMITRPIRRTPTSTATPILPMEQPPKTRAATPLTRLGETQLSPFAKKLVEILRAQPRLQMNLSQLASLLPRELRGNYKSLIVPVRKVRCVTLTKNDVEWVATLVVARESEDERGTGLSERARDFANRVRARLVAADGLMTLSHLGNHFPTDQRPLPSKSLRENLVAAMGDEIEFPLGTLQVVALAVTAASFAASVRDTLVEWNGTMTLSTLGSLFPPNMRPRPLLALKRQLAESLGNEIVITQITSTHHTVTLMIPQNHSSRQRRSRRGGRRRRREI